MSGMQLQQFYGERPLWRKRLFWGTLAALVLVGCLVVRAQVGPERASAKPPVPAVKKAGAVEQNGNKVQPATANAPAVDAKKPNLVAVLNNEPISRDDLAKECLRHYGEEVLETIMNKHMISMHCKAKGVSVTDKEVSEEIDRMAKKFSLPRDQYLQMLDKERSIKPGQYAKDIVWPTLALRKLAASQLTITKKELDAAFESQFGRAVKARLIAVRDKAKAEQIRSQCLAQPDKFGDIAKRSSEDVNSASANGLIQPIRKHLGDKNLEAAAFALKPGEISKVIEVANQFVILKCEGFLEAGKVERSQVDPMLEDALRDRKLHAAGSEMFKEVQKRSEVVKVYNDPEQSKKYPGVAAVINDQRITIRQLAEACVERHGADVLDGTLNRRLLEQELRRRKITVTEKDTDGEIERAALSMGMKLKNGQPDVDGWLKMVTQQQNISIDVYVRDAVWPSVALKKLVGDSVKITDEDLKKGYEANYGPRVRCRAIVLNSQRKAQEAWEKARDNPTVANFAKLAEKYSIEANSASLGGEVPPIQKHGGQPVLETEAFKLKAGELSSIIQVSDTFVILLCEGYTKPEKHDFKEIEPQLRDDILEKKQRVAMSKEFERLKEEAQIDNYLAGTIKYPKSHDSASLKDKATTAPATKRK